MTSIHQSCVSKQADVGVWSDRTPLSPTRRQLLALLAAGPLVALSGCTGDPDPVGDTGLGGSAPGGGPGDVQGPDPGLGSGGSILGNYRGTSILEFLFNGERRSIQSAAVVAINEPAEWLGQVEDNPFFLLIEVPFNSETGYVEGMYKISSAAILHEVRNEPGIDYSTTPSWLVKEWDLTFDGSRFTGVFTNTDSATLNTIWYESPAGTMGIDSGYIKPIPYPATVGPTYLRGDARLEGTVGGDRVTVTVTGTTTQLDAFRITVTAERPRL